MFFFYNFKILGFKKRREINKVVFLNYEWGFLKCIIGYLGYEERRLVMFNLFVFIFYFEKYKRYIEFV